MIVLVELASDDAAELDRRMVHLQHDIRGFARTHAGIQIHVLKTKTEEQKYWTIRRESFALLHGHVKDRDTAPFIDDFAVSPEFMPEFLPKLEALLDPYRRDLLYTIEGHPGNGNFDIIPLMDLTQPRIRNLIPEISEKV